MKSAITLQRWHSLYRSKGGFFSHPRSSKSGKGKLHPFLELYSSAKDDLKMFCRSNINSLSVENVHDHIMNVILPDLAKTTNTDITIILQSFRIKNLCFSTVLKWMHDIGFRYSTRKKTYYVDNHAKPLKNIYRKVYGHHYLVREKMMHHYIQITEE